MMAIAAGAVLTGWAGWWLAARFSGAEPAAVTIDLGEVDELRRERLQAALTLQTRSRQ